MKKHVIDASYDASRLVSGRLRPTKDPHVVKPRGHAPHADASTKKSHLSRRSLGIRSELAGGND
jgi:hypothetical protein